VSRRLACTRTTNETGAHPCIDAKDDGAFESLTRFAAKGGLGVEYRLRNNVGLFAQGATYGYDYQRGGFDKRQWDLLWTAGLTYHLPR
jgi:hypothetical protein